MNPIDTAITLWINGLAGAFTPLDSIIRLLASDYLVPPIFALTIIGTMFAGSTPRQRREWQRAAFRGMIAVGLANAPVIILNTVWNRPRPYLALGSHIQLLFYPSTDPSFPANPTAVGFAAAGALWKINPRLRYSLMAVALLMGFARVYAGLFYPTDIVGGAAIGLAVAYLTGWIMRLFDPAMNLALKVARAFAVA